MHARGASLSIRTAQAAAVIMALAGCDGAEKNVPAPSPNAAPAAPAYATGSEVWVSTDGRAFHRGKVARATATEVTVERDAPGAGAALTVPAAQVWGVEAAAPKAGDAALCRGADDWAPCRVVRHAGRTVEATDLFGGAITLESAQVATPPTAAREAVEKLIVREERERRFEVALQGAGVPHRPAGWTPSVGQKVIAHFAGSSWYEAEVVATKPERGKVRVHWAGNTWADRDLPTRAVAPAPPCAIEPTRGGFVLMPPDDAAPARWEPHRVERVEGAEVHGIDKRGTRRSCDKSKALVVAPVPATEGSG